MDRVLLGVATDTPAAQPVWETYALLLAVRAWQPIIAGSSGPLALRGDAKGILQAVVQRRARNALVNAMVAEISLVLGHGFQDLAASHW